MTIPEQSAGAPEVSTAPWYWCDFEPGRSKAGKTPPGSDLAALRLGLTLSAGTVPQMWRHYRSKVDDSLAARGLVPDKLVAEHMALSLFAMHQQGQARLMHARGVGLGQAARALHERFSTDGVDGRMAAAAQARSLNAVFFAVRGLVSQLASIGQPLDYTQVLYDLQSWPYPDSRARTVRAWGMTYHAYTKPTGTSASSN
ncbi:type I-E CRISPR-associated protein Cse2/CasB [Streptomyces sp. ZAF1911]|uniref:type I-E CRISPR-associated protein Cse2/CasB n=1 Tax=Streptomyces sp. ZAF1911 TaxID=2944129 RepID=UPI00237C31FE|nr:type I-E CRISPR-associated protein Cse2/CasB [Streptomyces sp. ZAF1911]MDD9380370.1 type I-E CRISPR-associated protein Cse2/CasB [Streptomyces sp. ZAF1911]